jgi:hypothetical protein
MLETRLGFFVGPKLEEPLIFESLILEFRWRNSERSMAPKKAEAQPRIDS